MSHDSSKIQYYDLRLEANKNRLTACVGRKNETERLTRILLRRTQHHIILNAPSGVGKTALIYGWAQSAAQKDALSNFNLVMFDSASLQKIGSLPPQSLPAASEHFYGIENCVIIIDSFGEMVYQSPQALQNWNTIIKPLFLREDLRIILTMQPEELNWIKEVKSHFLSHFEIVGLEALNQESQIAVLKTHADKLKINAAPMLEEIINLTLKFPALGPTPKSAITLLDECLTASKLNQLALSPALPRFLASEKLGIPLKQLNGKEKQVLKNLHATLSEKVVGQNASLSHIVNVIQRARLGLKNPQRPLGSFLLLGPSGVGKTETAKVLAEELYGSQKNFLRVDMSEFSQEHSVARLLGSPAGYIGYSEGGQLTNHFKNKPYSLLLLDEIEKAHAKTFDIFLQILDDGRLTSAQGETVDFTQSVIFATSNSGVNAILTAYNKGDDITSDEFIKFKLMPVLLDHFRPEFLNRFDAILVYNPLSEEALVKIAMLEIAKIEKRIERHNLKFEIEREILLSQLKNFADPRFGARPVKRFIEETCEALIVEALLK
ncbi:MAG: AAA family ATPase [Patescibacteria group bacterium]